MNKTLINYILKSNRIYTQNDCYHVCSHLFALEECNCGCNSSIYNSDKDFKKRHSSAGQDTPFFAKFTETYLKKFRKKLQNEKFSKYCPLECNSIS